MSLIMNVLAHRSPKDVLIQSISKVTRSRQWKQVRINICRRAGISEHIQGFYLFCHQQALWSIDEATCPEETHYNYTSDRNLQHSSYAWSRRWQPTPVSLPGESPGREEPGGLQLMGSQSLGWDNWIQSFYIIIPTYWEKQKRNNRGKNPIR